MFFLIQSTKVAYPETVCFSDAFSIAVPAKIRPSDRLYRWQPTE
ncbi:MAG: hypothetical protein ACI4AM_02370 [Muribaculaceae bacterium]